MIDIHPKKELRQERNIPGYFTPTGAPLWLDTGFLSPSYTLSTYENVL